MSRMSTVCAAIVGALSSACGDERTASEAPPPAVDHAPVESARERPMPAVSIRAQRVLAELGPEADALRNAITVEKGRLTMPRRDALVAIGPRARAALRRHNVRIEELARQLGDTP
jgi:hypothetical protein